MRWVFWPSCHCDNYTHCAAWIARTGRPPFFPVKLPTMFRFSRCSLQLRRIRASNERFGHAKATSNTPLKERKMPLFPLLTSPEMRKYFHIASVWRHAIASISTVQTPSGFHCNMRVVNVRQTDTVRKKPIPRPSGVALHKLFRRMLCHPQIPQPTSLCFGSSFIEVRIYFPLSASGGPHAHRLGHRSVLQEAPRQNRRGASFRFASLPFSSSPRTRPPCDC